MRTKACYVLNLFLKMRLSRTFLLFLVFLAAVQSVWIFILGFSYPILDAHAFRQTQTALSVYWMGHGGALLNYETPVLGAPWAIPFEFPIYQWMVLGVSRVSGLPLDGAGRSVSYAFFLLTLIPLRVISGYFYKSRDVFLISVILFLISPIYLFWSRTFMIESVALFASLSFIACVIRWVQAPSLLKLAFATLFATLAALQKITTFLPAAIVAGVIALDYMWRIVPSKLEGERTFRKAIFEVFRFFPLVLPVIVSIVLFEFWLKWSDQSKALNSFGDSLTSAALTSWNFGSWAQRVSWPFWLVVHSRIFPQTVASLEVVILLFGVVFFLKPKCMKSALLVLPGFFGGLLLFSNLHFVHNYYQYAISIYLILAVAFVVHEVERVRPLLGVVSLFVLMISCEFVFFAGGQSYFHAVRNGASLQDSQTMQLARFIKEKTPQDSVIIGFGYDWSSELSYYAERRSLMVPSWAKDDRLKDILEDPKPYLGGLPIGAVVVCQSDTPPGQKSLIDSSVGFTGLLAGMNRTVVSGCDVAWN
ncbi:hypothetical protein [Pleomorphomonas sp. PLEO]|uniref:hypothetical protein n=1 Tax=Pleomorphomonas sp. PLEO TaxID=3239306 RepID=UPI00351DC030